MEFDCQHSLHISSQITYKNDLTYHRKYYIKYAKYFNLATSLRLSEKREWHLFFKRMKVLRKIDASSSFQTTLEPSLPFAIEVLKGKRCLNSIPIKFKFSQQKQNPHNRLYACKLIKCLNTPKEVALSLHGKIDNVFHAILKQIEALRKIVSFKIQISTLTPNQVDISKGLKAIFRALNSFVDLSKVTMHFQDIQLSDQSLRELFRMDKLKRPVKEMELLTDRLLDIEDQFDDFAMPAAPINNDLNSIWEKFSTIETLAGSLTYLHLQPLLRSALDHNYLKYFFIPLAKLQNLKILKMDMPNLELTDDDVKALSNSISCLKNLEIFKVLLQFGMIMQKTLDNFFKSFSALNLREVYFYLTYATMSDFSEFYRAMPHNRNLEILSYDMTYLANVQYDPSLCEGVLGLRKLRAISLSEKPLMRGLLPSKEKFNLCFRGMFSSFVHTYCLESFTMHSIKTSADNDNVNVITETLPHLSYLNELIFDVDWKDYMIDYEHGMKFWEAIIEKTKLKTLIFNGLFRGAEHLLPFLRKRLEVLGELECLWAKFESETLSPEQIVLFVKRTTEHRVMKDLRLYFRVKQSLSNKLIERIQQILNRDKYLKKCLIEIQTNNGQQSISSESKGIFRPGQDFYYF